MPPEDLEELPDEPTAVVLFDIFGLFDMIKRMAAQAGAGIPIPLEAPADLPPPIAFSVTVEEEGLSADLAIPAKLVQTLVQLGVEQMQQAAPPQP